MLCCLSITVFAQKSEQFDGLYKNEDQNSFVSIESKNKKVIGFLYEKNCNPLKISVKPKGENLEGTA